MKSSLFLRPASRDDAPSIRKIAVSSGLFTSEEVDFLNPMLEGYFDGTLEGHHWAVVVDDGDVVAAAYWAPEPFSFRMTNLYFIATSPDAQGTGAGTMLLKHVEETLRALGPEAAQTLIVETSSTQRYAATREFYRKRGFEQEATIRRFYGPDDHKVVYWKSLID